MLCVCSAKYLLGEVRVVDQSGVVVVVKAVWGWWLGRGIFHGPALLS